MFAIKPTAFKVRSDLASVAEDLKPEWRSVASVALMSPLLLPFKVRLIAT